MTGVRVALLTLPVLLPGLALIVALKKGWWGALRRPIDAGLVVRGRALIGSNKTWLGVGLYVLGGAAVTLAIDAAWPAFVPPSGALTALMGASVGGAYAAGEIINSLIKRRCGIPPGTVTSSRGRRWQQAADLADGIVCSAAVYALWSVPVLTCVAVACVGLLIHLGTDALMRRLALKRDQHQRRDHGDRDVVQSPAADSLDRG